MPRFIYKARDAQNKLVTGSMDEENVGKIIAKLAEKNLTPVSIEEPSFDGTSKSQTFLDKLKSGFDTFQNRVPYKDVVFFTRQLATMLSAGVAIAKALNKLAEAQKPVFKKIINTIEDDISSGFTFADAVARHPGAFNSMYISVSRSGEVTGSLDRVLGELADYMENVEAMRAKVKGAMRYPTFILGFVSLMLIGIMWKLVPTFEGMYSSMGATLPAPTLILITISHFVKNFFPLIILAIILGVVLFKVGMTKDKFRFVVHSYILQVPIFGMILKKNIWATFSRTMALLLECGIPILQATEIGAAVVNNMLYAKSLKEVYESLKQGVLLSNCLEKTKLFPVLITQLVATGEESGKIDALLRKASDFYEREIRVTVDSMASIIEPILIIVLGGIVGFVLIALYMPVFMLGKVIGG